MLSSSISPFLSEAISWVLESGDLILKIYHSDFVVQEKSKNDPVTEADLQTSKLIEGKIHSIFPEHGFLSEESSDDLSRLQKEYVWILDPIDGTREFVTRNPEFAVSLGLTFNSKAILGVILNPVTGELVVRETDQPSGVFLLKPPFTPQNPLGQIKIIPERNPPSAHSRSSLDKPILLVSHSEFKMGLFEESFWKDNFTLRSVGSIAYKLALLAKGDCDLVLSFKPKNEWDICAGIALLDPKIFSFKPLLDRNSYSFNSKDTKTYGLLAGKQWALQRLFGVLPEESLMNRVSRTW